METKKRQALVTKVKPQALRQCVKDYRARKGELDTALRIAGVAHCRIYLEEVGGQPYLFQYSESGTDTAPPVQLPGGSWREARQVYEFKKRPGGEWKDLNSRGIIIGVKPGMLERYIELHDNQPQIIHDLCYQNGFRKSSIFVAGLSGNESYLLQFVEYKGEENPALYEDETYREWLRVTGECQQPLPGEAFWKEMQPIYTFNTASR